MSHPDESSPSPLLPPLRAVQAGWRRVVAADLRAKVVLLALVLLTLCMLPVGRSGPDDGGGLLAPLTFDSGQPFRKTPAADFFSVYDAGSRILEFQDPYGVNAATGGPGLRAPYVATFRYLPVTAFWLAVPLNILPPWPAYYTWVTINFLFLILNFLLCTGRRPERILLFGLLWFGWFPVIAELHMGQFSLFMATALLWGIDGIWSAASRGIGWALAVLIKVFPLAMAPSLFLWGRRRLVLITVGIVVLTTLGWKFLGPPGMEEGLVNRGISGRIINQERMPYAGAMGVQEMVNAIVRKAGGHSFLDDPGAPGAIWIDPVAIGCGVLLAAYAGICLWALIRTRRAPSLAAIGLFWMTWFFAYVDAWEHHYVFIQALVALLIAWRVIDWKVALAAWLCCGAPSLWWFWQRSGYAGNGLAESIGLLYFLQRPVGLFVLAGALFRKV